MHPRSESNVSIGEFEAPPPNNDHSDVEKKPVAFRQPGARPQVRRVAMSDSEDVDERQSPPRPIKSPPF